jgi:hypothetical protein
MEWLPDVCTLREWTHWPLVRPFIDSLSLIKKVDVDVVSVHLAALGPSALLLPRAHAAFGRSLSMFWTSLQDITHLLLNV